MRWSDVAEENEEVLQLEMCTSCRAVSASSNTMYLMGGPQITYWRQTRQPAPALNQAEVKAQQASQKRAATKALTFQKKGRK
jgi:hypothetical protein